MLRWITGERRDGRERFRTVGLMRMRARDLEWGAGGRDGSIDREPDGLENGRIYVRRIRLHEIESLYFEGGLADLNWQGHDGSPG